MAEPWQTAGNTSQKVSAIAAAVSLCVALGAIWFVWQQILNSRETTARQFFRQHLELAIQNPTFSSPDYQAIEKDGAATLAQYGFFVEHLLFTCDEILWAFAGDLDWRAACVSHVTPHAAYLCGHVAGTSLSTYSRDMQNLIKSVMTAASSTVPACAKWKA
jgi:hypothetical protein